MSNSITKSLLQILICAQIIFALGLSCVHAKNVPIQTHLFRIEFQIEGASCIACIRRIERELRTTNGVMRADIIPTKPVRAIVYYNRQQIKPDTFIQHIVKGGYPVHTLSDVPTNKISVPEMPVDKNINNFSNPPLLSPPKPDMS